MMVRRYVVKEMPEAVMLIRRELGKDAVILSSKKISQKKWLGLWRSTAIEVVAAVGDDIPVRAPNSTLGASLASDTSKFPHSSSGNQVQEATRFVPLTNQPELSSRESTQVATEVKPSDAQQIVEVPLIGHEDMNSLRRELSEMKRMLEMSLSSDDFTETSLFSRLLDQGMERETAVAICEAAQVKKEPYIGQKKSIVEDDVEAVIKEKLGTLNDSQPIAPSSRVIALVGPTGVGKTTTVAKLAALSVLAGRNVGLITTDTYRIAAVEQLKTYATILNVPLEVVYKQGDMVAAYEKLRDRDLIFIDTAGRSYRSEENLQEIRAWLASVPVDETLLVLSMAAKPQDADYIASVFTQVPAQKFVFTKLDETSSYATIINLLLKYRLPVSYFTTGQNVPDDIEVALIDKIVKWVVGGTI